MKYYIDFDNTLYNTSKLTNIMISVVAKELCKYNGKDIEENIEEVKLKFSKNNIYNIFKVCDYFSNKYNFDDRHLKRNIFENIMNGKDNVYTDDIRFLKKLKEDGNSLIMLTFSPVENNDYQLMKIAGSKLSKYFDNIIITSNLKSKLGFDLDFENSVFIDDNPEMLYEIYTRNPKRLIRIKRKNSKYSNDKLNINIEEYESFKDIL